jgi:hypothetical protein
MPFDPIRRDDELNSLMEEVEHNASRYVSAAMAFSARTRALVAESREAIERSKALMARRDRYTI